MKSFKQIKKNQSTYLSWLYAIFNGSRMTIGSFNVLYLLSTGLDIKYIAILQTVFTVVAMIVEFPSGIIGDKFGHKTCVLISCFLASLYYILCLFSPNLFLLILSQVLYACSLSFISGSIEAWITNSIEKEVVYKHSEEKELIKDVAVVYRNELKTFLVIFFSCLGTFIVYINNNNYRPAYIFASIILIILFILFFIAESDDSHKQFKENGDLTFLNSFKKNFNNVNFWFYIISLACIVSSIQVIYFYWQPAFRDIDISGSGKLIGRESILTSIVFFSFCTSNFIWNRVVRLNMPKIKNNFFTLKICAIVCIVCAISFGRFTSSNLLISILIFSTWQGALSVIQALLEAQILKTIDGNIIASILSIASSISSIFSIIVLLVLARYLNENNIFLFFNGTALLFLMFFAILFFWERYTIRT